MNQKPLYQIGEIKTYPIDPGIFLEIRIQIILALFFMLVCGLDSLPKWRHRASFSWIIVTVERILAVVILFFAANFLIYMGILEWGTDLADNPFLAHFYAHEQGLPMRSYDPSYGFVLFVLCCSALIWISLRSRSTATKSVGHEHSVSGRG